MTIHDDHSHTFLESLNSEPIEYLYKTEVYMMRNRENGTAIPQEIIDGRADAWAAINGDLL